jgi:MEMO1 family protein
MKRKPVVAGQFYPEQPDTLRKMVRKYLSPPAEERPAIGIISPHAGYIYSGSIAGKTFAQVKVPDRVVILGPNHHGHGHPAAISSAESWLTPLGETAVDSELANLILKKCPDMVSDETAHRYEHSLEVQLPFIQIRAPESAIVPICLSHGPLDLLLDMGESLGNVLADYPGKVMMIASSDMTHYESGVIAREKDMRALDRILALDPKGLYRTVRDQRISMCGVVPVVVMLVAAKRLGAKTASLVHYGNSGDVTGDQSQVVGYAGVVIE